MKHLNFDKKQQRLYRHKRTFNHIKEINTDNKPRLIVTKTNANIFVQLVDCKTQTTLASSSSLQLKLANGNVQNSELVGKDIAQKIKKLGITEIIFDRGGSKYHGKIAKLAEAARAEGLKF